MQLHWGWAALAALALAAGLIWWTRPANESGHRSGSSDRHDAGHRGRSHADAGPTLYRWIDANGVVNITSGHPPADRRYTIVRIDPNQNVVPMSAGDSALRGATTAHR